MSLPRQSQGAPTLQGTTVEELRAEMQFWLTHYSNLLDDLVGARGTPTFQSDVNVNGHAVQNLAVPPLTENPAMSMTAVPRKFALPLVQQRNGSMLWDLRSLALINGRDATTPTGIPTLAQIEDLVLQLLREQGHLEGSFTVTGTGFAANPTATARYITDLSGKWVALFVPEGLTGTSNNATFTLTGLPVSITPTQTSQHIVVVTDGEGGGGGTTAYGLLTLTAASPVITLVSPVNADGSWTNSGPKAILSTWVTYALL